jgi:crotonobetaine/carnitine-CoA ligase
VTLYDGAWTFGALLDDRAERWPDRRAVMSVDGELTYGQVRDRAQRVAAGLRELGVRPGDRVATMLESTNEYLAAWHGTAWAGAIDVPVNTELRGTFLEHVLNDSGSRVLVVDGRWLDRLAGLELPALEHVVVVGEPRGDGPQLPRHPLAELLEREPAPLARRDETDLVYILYTSGTTGRSKGATYTNRSSCWFPQPYIEKLRLTADDVGYSMFPLFHVMGRSAMVTTSLWVGCPVAVRPRFSVSGFWDDIRRTGTTWFGYFGAVILFLWREPQRADDADNPVRRAFGAAAPAELQEAWGRRFGLDLLEVYGSTELGLGSCPTPATVKRGTMGTPVAHLELAIHDERDNPLPPGVAGELVARPRHPHAMFAGYWRRPEDTLAAFRNLWFHTGDAALLDEDGHLVFTDRIKDSIRRRGENISSFEVEEVVRGLPLVVECAAYAVPSDHGDDEVMVAVVLEPEAELDAPSFFADLIPAMPRFALPRYVRVVGELPKTASQRVRKHLLRDEGVTPDTVDREALGIRPPRE